MLILQINKLLIIDYTVSISITILILISFGIFLGALIKPNSNIPLSVISILAIIFAGFTIISNIIIKKRQREYNAMSFKSKILDKNLFIINFNNDEKDNTIDRFFSGDEILVDVPELNGKISVKLMLEEKNEKDNL